MLPPSGDADTDGPALKAELDELRATEQKLRSQYDSLIADYADVEGKAEATKAELERSKARLANFEKAVCSALARARTAGLEASEVSAAETVVAEKVRKRDALAVLERAVESRSIDELRSTLEEARAANAAE